MPTPLCIDQANIKPVDKIIRLVSGKNIGDLNQNDINYAIKFYYDCINLMKSGKICCLTVD